MSKGVIAGVLRFGLNVWLWCQGRSVAIYATVLASLLVLIALAPFIFVAIPPGHVGVVWSRFGGGTITDHVLSEGTHVIAPWNTLAVYDARMRNNTARYSAIASNGVIVEVEVAVRYHVNPVAAGQLHKLVGPDYPEVYIYPKVGSLVYDLTSRAPPEALYSTNRRVLEAQLLAGARTAFSKPPPDVAGRVSGPFEPLIVIDDLMISAIVLPPWVRKAIDRKLEQEQLMHEYDFRLASERKEAERKRIEAEGIRAFQATVAPNITPDYLRLRGIEATKALAESPNAKTVIIGGRDGLPVILNTDGDETGRSRR